MLDELLDQVVGGGELLHEVLRLRESLRVDLVLDYFPLRLMLRLPYRGTSLIRKRHPVGPYYRPMPGDLK